MSVRLRESRAVLRACALLVVCACAAEPVANSKRAESEFMSPMPFVLGSRYGRAQPRHIAPRNDRFFMGSRYGKRSEPRVGAAPPLVPQPPRLLCEPAGLYQLYRCSPHVAGNRRVTDDRASSQTSEDE